MSITLLGLYRYASANGWVGTSELAAIGPFVLAVSSALCAQNGFVSGGRRRGTVVVRFNLLSVIVSVGALLVTMVTAWLQPMFLWLPLVVSWVLAAGAAGLFRCWVRAGYFELRPTDQS